ncbi:MAG TPA: CapA family protein [Caulobacteraceae bacterium]|jgi:poly-gamma-glutamate synthesis protein (capsule biosynthesis protein)|nr:CapA family protein [Caulobacteraceae bacterium]
MKRTVSRRASLALFGAGLAAAWTGRALAAGTKQPGDFPDAPKVIWDYHTQIPAVRPATTVKAGFTFAAAGDLIYSLPMLPRGDAGIEALSKVIHAADASLANQEGSILDLQSFDGYMEAENGGGYPVGSPALARDIAGLGFTFANKANNHAMDFGRAGLLETRRHLQEAGLLTPGVGDNRALARAAQIKDTPHGRVAVIGAASTFPLSAPAGAAGGVAKGRPGIDVVRTRRITLVTASEMASLRAMAREHGQTRPDSTELSFGGEAFRTAAKPGYTYDIDPVDRFEILRAVRGAKNVADAAVFTIHAHENAGMGSDRVPADFQQALYHDVVDAGGDVVAVHGPHLTRGVEIYKGRPIFYGLGGFAYQMLGSAPMTPEDYENLEVDPRFVTNGDADAGGSPSAWYGGLLAVTEFGDGGAVREVRLHPIDLRESDPQKSRGLPQPATGERARQIIAQVQADSAPYRTKIGFENDLGVIRGPF